MRVALKFPTLCLGLALPLIAPASLAATPSEPKAARQYCVERYPARPAHAEPFRQPHMRLHTLGQSRGSGAKTQMDAAIPTAPPRPPHVRSAPAASPAEATREAREALYGERFTATEPGAVINPATNPVSTFGADVDTASYAHIRRWLNRGRLPPADAVRPEEVINAFAYDYQPPAAAADGFRPTISLHPAPWSTDRRLLHIGVKAFDPPAEARPPANLVLLVDTSGSMANADKLPLIRQAVCILAHRLEAEDRIGIVAYANGARIVLDSTAIRDRDRVLAALDGLVAGGGTAGGAGLRMAYAMARRDFKGERINRVLLATDGDFNIGIDDPRELTTFIRRQAADGVFLSVLGVGGGNIRDDITQALAQNGNGVAAHLDSLAEAERVLARELVGTLFTVAKDVKFQVEFNPAKITSYRLIGYETRKLTEADFANDAKDAGDMGAGHAVTALYEVTLAGDGASPFPPRRYGASTSTDDAASNEFAFLRIRFKPVAAGADVPPTEQATAIDDSHVNVSLADAGPDMRFAAAVAWFAQKLRGDALAPAGQDDWTAIADLAETALGDDPYRERRAFVELARKAKAIDPAG